MEEIDALERYLQEALILTWGDAGNIDGGHPEKHRVLLAGGVQVLAKPALPGVERVPVRESAGWHVAKDLGFLGLVAATVVRPVPRLATGVEIDHSLQVIWPDGRLWLTPLHEFPEREIWEAAIFDAVVAHSDHGNNNWFGIPDPAKGETHLRLVDTGNAFDLNPNQAVNSSFVTHHRGDELPDWASEAVEAFVQDFPPVIESLLGMPEADRVRARAGKLASDGKLEIP